MHLTLTIQVGVTITLHLHNVAHDLLSLLFESLCQFFPEAEVHNILCLPPSFQVYSHTNPQLRI